MHEKKLEQLQLTEICQRAGVNRSTFYRYYDSIKDWCDQMRRSYLQGDELMVGICEDATLSGRVMFLIGFLRKNERLFSLLLSEEERFLFLDNLFGSVIALPDIACSKRFAYAGLLSVCTGSINLNDENADRKLAEDAALLIDKLTEK